MTDKTRLTEIREKERNSHIAMYSDSSLYQRNDWLKKPIKTVLELFPHFQFYTSLRVLDLGCGIGRNCIPIAEHFRDIPCCVDCVDILELAIEKLNQNAAEYGVSESINGIIQSINSFPIFPKVYDWIMAISALEHVDTEESFIRKLAEIREGIKENGIVCLVINSNVTELDKRSGSLLPAQFEVNLPTEELQMLLAQTFEGWKVLKSTVRDQQYDIPRESGIVELHTTVVTFAAVKQ